MHTSTEILLARPAAEGRQRSGITRALWDSYAAAAIRTGIPLLLADVSAVVFAVLAGRAFRDSWTASLDLSPSNVIVLGASLVACLALAGHYPGVALNPVAELRGIALATTLAFAFYLVAGGGRGEFPAPWPLVVASWLLALLCVAGGRVVVRSIFSRFSWWGLPTVVAGEAAAAEQVHEALRSDPGRGLRPLALLGESTTQWREAVVDPAIHYAVLAVSEGSRADQTLKIAELARRFRRVIIVSPETSVFLNGLAFRASLFPAHRVDLFKRSFDLVLVTLVSPALLFLTIVVALLNKATSRGSIFFGHERIGRDGRLFKAWKFRTMVMNADALLQQHLEQQAHLQDEWQRTQKLQNDPRVTTIGRWLRRTSLDELPQIWNIFRGEMTLIGPRPIVREEIPRYGASFGFYTRVRPGLTGLWQVSGRIGTTYAQRVALDSFYVRNRSVWLDLYIFLRTFRVVLTGDGAR